MCIQSETSVHQILPAQFSGAGKQLMRFQILTSIFVRSRHKLGTPINSTFGIQLSLNSSKPAYGVSLDRKDQKYVKRRVNGSEIFRRCSKRG